MIGLGSTKSPLIDHIASFCSKCGTAFQLQDDILGVVGSEAQIGKSVGADIREGKKTVIVYRALQNANNSQRAELLAILGNLQATPDQVTRATELLRALDGIHYTQTLAQRYVSEALDSLAIIPASQNKELLQQWAEYLVDRQF